MKVMLLSLTIVSGFRALNNWFVKELKIEKEITLFLSQTIIVFAFVSLFAIGELKKRKITSTNCLKHIKTDKKIILVSMDHLLME
jgi:hypothetical protein